MRARGIEPPRVLPHKNLNLARLPIPPRPRRIGIVAVTPNAQAGASVLWHPLDCIRALASARLHPFGCIPTTRRRAGPSAASSKPAFVTVRSPLPIRRRAEIPLEGCAFEGGLSFNRVHSSPRGVRGVIAASGFSARLARIPALISAARSACSRMNCLDASRPWPNLTCP